LQCVAKIGHQPFILPEHFRSDSGFVQEISMTNIDIESGLAGFFAQDHRDCDARWADVEELLDTADIDTARSAWQKYNASMRRHLLMEEEVLFPAFDARSGMAGGGPVAVMKMEHQQMRGLLDQIGDAIDAGDAQEAMDIGDTLLMLIQQHNVKEEGMLYPMAENMLAGDWAALAAQLEKY
jgi:hemerythrin superfamily protein